ncbi:hypothetical protein BpHYR1_013793 [Brachionus plicatilis]|uniref:Uncharacterized protein n=1 Tax=Brachionus plicatilis TaxID=10195 RepID=A0A3M7S7C3_BRAPC|nr:hypothetical protein BpHYR1_013793 [Brachionus plicatilis]
MCHIYFFVSHIEKLKNFNIKKIENFNRLFEKHERYSGFKQSTFVWKPQTNKIVTTTTTTKFYILVSSGTTPKASLEILASILLINTGITFFNFKNKSF